MKTKRMSPALPSYVDDVLEYANFASLPLEGVSGIIYVPKDTNLTYRWTGSAYVEISKSLALGETALTAYRGDRGKIGYDHSLVVVGNPHVVTKTEVGLGNADNTADIAKPVSTAQQTALDGKVSHSLATAVSDFLVASVAGAFVKKTFAEVKTILGIPYVHPNHSGDVTSVADGAQTIAANAVTNAKAAQMATKTYKGRTSALTGNAEDVAVATVKADLVLVKADVGLGNADNTADTAKPVSTAQQAALDLKLNIADGISLLSVTTVSFAANGDTVIYTVPTGKRCVLVSAIIVAAGDAGLTTTLSIGQALSETDFVGAHTLSNLDVQYDSVMLMAYNGTSTPSKMKSYAAATVIEAQVAAFSGVIGNSLYLYGFLY